MTDAQDTLESLTERVVNQHARIFRQRGVYQELKASGQTEEARKAGELLGTMLDQLVQMHKDLTAAERRGKQARAEPPELYPSRGDPARVTWL